MAPECGPTPNQGGFTLLETVVALAILAVAMGAVTTLLHNGLAASRQAEVMTEETALARSWLARAGVDDPLVVGAATGDAGGGFRWLRRVEPLPAGAGQELARAVDGILPVVVTLTVSRGGDAGVTLVTLRLLPSGGGAQ